MKNVLSKKNLRQLVAFAVIGILNTISDFVIFNILYGVFNFPLFLANVLAVTLVMGISLQLNRKYVFGATGDNYTGQAVKFMIVTLSGLYVIQNVILFVILGMIEGLHIQSGPLSNHIVQANAAKAVGVGGSAIWNFVLYKLWVFRANKSAQSSEVSTDYL